MRKLFSKPHERQKGSFDASEIEIIGVGCGGTNIVNYMQTHGFKDFPLAVCDMDASVIEHSTVREKLLFGMDGLGAGNNPKLGKSEAEKKMIDIRSIIKEHTKVSFVVVCLGGGCGTGASPVVAREIKKRGVKTIGVATLPFEFEGRLKFNQAMDGLIELATYTDAIFVLNNQYILNHHPELAMNAAFTMADELMAKVVWSIIDFMYVNRNSKHTNGIIGYIKKLFTLFDLSDSES